jgi:hypothetical protein
MERGTDLSLQKVLNTIQPYLLLIIAPDCRYQSRHRREWLSAKGVFPSQEENYERIPSDD